jgi:hypothetical protein
MWCAGQHADALPRVSTRRYAEWRSGAHACAPANERDAIGWKPTANGKRNLLRRLAWVNPRSGFRYCAAGGFEPPGKGVM